MKLIEKILQQINFQIEKKDLSMDMNGNNPTVLLSEDLGGKMGVVRAETPEMGKRKLTLKLILDYRTAVDANGDVSVVLGDASGMFRYKIPTLQKINSKLIIGGTYGKETLKILNDFANGHVVRLHEIQASATDKEFFDDVIPLQYVQGMLGDSPSTNPVDLQMEIGPDSLNLTVRKDKTFRFDASATTALQMNVPFGKMVSYTFYIYAVGTGALMEMQ